MDNDLISREDLKSTIIGICGKCSNIITKYENGVPDGNCAIQHILNMIDNAPTVEGFTKEDMSGAYNEGYACGSRENTRPQGEWICHSDSHITFYTCNRCNSFGYKDDKFCNNCGAKMKGGAENDTN